MNRPFANRGIYWRYGVPTIRHHRYYLTSNKGAENRLRAGNASQGVPIRFAALTAPPQSSCSTALSRRTVKTMVLESKLSLTTTKTHCGSGTRTVWSRN